MPLLEGATDWINKKENEERLITQTRLFATITLFLGLGVPVIYEFIK